jgi:hypothetical protein
MDLGECRNCGRGILLRAGHFAAAFTCAVASVTALRASAQAPVSFGRDVWPIIAARCVECHGADKQEGKLRLDSPEGVRAGGEYGAIVVGGDLAKSTLYELITKDHADPDRMPNKGEPLGATDVATLRAWIDQGAKLEGWSPELLQAIPPRDTVMAIIPAADTLPREALTYNRDIRPLLSNYCFPCHGPDKGARKVDLRLDQAAIATALRPDGVRPITPGQLGESEVVRRLFHPDPAKRMPPSDQNRQPTDEQRRSIAAWIAQGAVYEPHWSFIAPRRAQPPRVAGLENPIDRFIAARLEKEGLALSPQAGPADLVRRLSFDLTGLPPGSAQVEAFRGDPSDAAYERLLDELLASPRYGERMAVHWLDLVRYADTNGYHSDESRKVWAYRDWVIDAFNTNKPYDLFSREQLAGDLLPNATREQIVASSYNRMNQITAEGGAQPGEYTVKYAADRVRNVSAVWLGVTLGCAECHDHKFDPFLTKDFYSLAAFFADVDEFGVYTTGERWDPIYFLASPEEQMEIDRLRAEITVKETAMAAADLSAPQRTWEEHLRSGPLSTWSPVWPVEMVSEGGATMTVLPDYSVLATGTNPSSDKYTVALGKTDRGLPALRLEVLGDPSLNGGFSRADRGGFEMSEVEIERKAKDGTWQKVEIASVVEDFSKGGKGADKLIDGHLYTRWSVRPRKPIDDRVSAVFTLAKPLPAGSDVRMNIEMRGLNRRTTVGRFRLSVTEHDDAGVDEGRIGEPADVVRAFRGKKAPNAVTAARAAAFFRAGAPELAEARGEIVAAHEKILAMRNTMNSTMATRALDVPRMTRILPRGNWMNESGALVEPDVPESLPTLMGVEGRRPTRLDLAEWMVSKDNPLTARAFVNRLWKLYFGRGISRVLDDLGAQGEWPTNPELLDWLAVEFRESGWDVKHMVRLIVTSRAYRQSSQASEELRERDPANLLCARQSRFRLEAEMVRDNALAVGGLLSAKIGGPTVKPYQPDGYWRDANTFGGESLEYKPAAGEDQYRRGLYTFWKRSFLHPALLAFDAPSREECTAQRPASNTPVQALVLLNDPSYVEAARAFAERIVSEGGKRPKKRIEWAMHEALSRRPAKAELRVLDKLYAAHKKEYRKDAAGAAALIAVGQHPAPAVVDPVELAAWTSVARTIMNLPEFITRF